MVENEITKNGAVDGVIDAAIDETTDTVIDKDSITPAYQAMKEAEAKAIEAGYIEGLKENVRLAEDAIPKTGIGTKIAIVVIAVLIVLGVVRGVQLYMQDEETEETALTNVQIQDVNLGSVEITSPLAGRIQVKDSIDVIPMAQGEVVAVNVEKGDHVSKGQVLFTIDSTQAQIQYQQALVSIQTLEDSIRNLETNCERTRKLYDSGAVAKTDLESLENTLDSTKLQLKNAQLGAQAASEALSNYTVTAPSSGYVTAVNVKTGGVAGQSIAVSISDTSSLELSASLSEYLVKSLKEGETVDVYVTSVSDEPFTGTVTDISETQGQGTYTYPVTVRINDQNGELKAGMFAEVRLVSARKENVIAIPSDAVITSGGDKKVVIYNSADETVSMRTVTVGVDNGTVAEITDGLSVSDVIVVKGQTYVMEGEKVRVVQPKS